MQRARFEALTFVWTCDQADSTLPLTGRNAWALSRLISAGERGVTPISEPSGPRWSAYIHNLRGLGIDIEKITEAHGGAFPGTHARYVLRSEVRLLKAGDGSAEPTE